MGSNVGDKAIAAMVVGGIGSIWGAIAGGLAIGLVETFVIYLLGGDFVQMAVLGTASWSSSSSGHAGCSAPPPPHGKL